MIENLDKELTRFKTLVKDGKTVQIKNAENYSGAGSFNVWWLLVFSSILIFRGLDR